MAEQRHFRKPANAGDAKVAPVATLPAQAAAAAKTPSGPPVRSLTLLRRFDLLPVKTLEAM